jgi:hypothetical protein
MKTGSTSEPRVSVVLPVFGSHSAVETIAIVCRAWLQQDVPCEVVIASARPASDLRLDDLEDERIRVVTLGSEVRSLSTLRNTGAAAARAPMVYLSDGDVVPLGRDFVRRSLEVASRGVLIQPWMYRVLNVPNLSCVKVPCHIDRRACFVRTEGDGDLVPVDGERFVWGNGMPWAYPPRDGVPGDPASMRKAPFHWGGILLPRQLFELVGGYCEQYIGWGGEDDDLLFKLETRSPILRAWCTAPELQCLHAEHPRLEITEEVRRNRQLLAQRFSHGASTMIDSDVSERRRRGISAFGAGA